MVLICVYRINTMTQVSCSEYIITTGSSQLAISHSDYMNALCILTLTVHSNVEFHFSIFLCSKGFSSNIFINIKALPHRLPWTITTGHIPLSVSYGHCQHLHWTNANSPILLPLN